MMTEQERKESRYRTKKRWERDNPEKVKAQRDRYYQGLKKRCGIPDCKKYSCEDRYFETIDREEKAYWLGFLAADGCVMDGRQKRVILKLSDTDKDHLCKFRDAIRSNTILYTEVRLGKYHQELVNNKVVISSIPMVIDLERHGITPRKTFTLKYPVQSLSPELNKHFIRGYFDGDGSVGLYGNQMIVSILGTMDIINNIKGILNIGGTIRSRHKSPIFEWRITCAMATRFSEIIYENATVFLERKKMIFDEYVSSRPVYSSEYPGVSIDRSRNKWKASVKLESGWKHIGRFDTELMAHSAVVNYGKAS